ncbi:hypothetical protein BS50DRAFT_486389 [Corynespora cassiicola Philippines]|uniref:Uncharacterized protein n=1 Tax=Corynespora cassiicola Philippines TaxID=1448308 RepID=A0A2T2NZI7_CORCC|nr:hypothetical protein BS50DRAFT_486389 [Corynespora cassiicola Philippines]
MADNPYGYDPLTELADLGIQRAERDTAAADRRDTALYYQQPVAVRQGRAEKGTESQIFAWKAYQHTTDEKDGKEAKGNLHSGQLHRQNRAARGEEPQPPPVVRGGRKGKGARDGNVFEGEEVMYAARKPAFPLPPQAKGIPEECAAEDFWEEPIV